jgi:hypothetical protein
MNPLSDSFDFLCGSFFSGNKPWAGMALGTDGLSAKYCELNRLDHWVRQPINTLSNAAFALVGIAILLERPANSRLAGLPRTLVGLSLCALAVGSALFHASITLAAQRMDMGATYAVVLALTGFAVAIRRPPEELGRWTVAILAADVLFVAFDLFRQGAWLLPLLLVAALGSASITRIRWSRAHLSGHFSAALVSMGVAGTAWILDDRKLGCDPTGDFQWHALWHIATAVAAFELYRYLDRAAEPSLG